MNNTYKIKLFLLVILTPLGLFAGNPHNITFGEIKAQGKIWGIDVSHHQSTIDWEKLKEQKPHFIFLKATEGSSRQDTKYHENYKEARKLGITVGSYHFFSYKSRGKDQAKNFLSTVIYKSGDLPLVLNAEFARTIPARKVVTNELVTFINIVFKKTGRYPIIYCDYDYYELYLKEHLQGKCKLWIVDYKNRPNCKWTFWQTTNKFKMAGIKGKVDFNLFNGSREKLDNLLL
ncbi:MAG: GH25 family lysozyme [Paludibacter sp.]